MKSKNGLMPHELQPGDCLLYRPNSIMGWVIAVKTWTAISHVEIYTGDLTSVASRDGIGVARYPLRRSNLAYVRRPSCKIPSTNIQHPEKHQVPGLDFARAMRWFRTVNGQKYDWKGLLCFTLAVHQGSMDRMFCSEFATRWYRKAGFDALAPEINADHVAPSEFVQTPALKTVWSDRDSRGRGRERG